MHRLISVLVLSLVCFVLTNAARADKRVALVVANGDYKGAPLENPTIDADIVASSLTNIGFAVKVVKNADLGRFDAAVSAFADTAKGADVALFYFAGHGFTVNDGIRPVSILMSTSADVTASSERVLRAGGLPLDEIAGSLVGQAKVTLVFVDACRNDPRVVRAIGGKGRGFAVLDPVQGGSLFIGLSTRLGGTARDGVAGVGSPFARAFAANIQTKGMRIDDAFRQLRDAVSSETGGGQLPDVVQDDLPNGAIILVSAQGEPPNSAASLETSERAARAAIVDCDRLAALPLDATRPAGIAGIEYERIDAAQAVPACRAAIALSPNDPRIAIQLGRALAKAGEAAEAERWFRKAADAGDAPGMTNLGLIYDPMGLIYDPMYEQGVGVSKDATEAVRWYRKAADAGYTPGMVGIGLNALASSPAPSATVAAEAVRWFRKAADAGDARGMTDLGVMYEQGVGVSKDATEAERWFRKAADAGDPHGMVGLGYMYEEGAGVSKDAAEAVRWFRKAADAGDALGMSGLGYMYEEGAGVSKDAAEAQRWYRKAGINGLGVSNYVLMQPWLGREWR